MSLLPTKRVPSLRYFDLPAPPKVFPIYVFSKTGYLFKLVNLRTPPAVDIWWLLKKHIWPVQAVDISYSVNLQVNQKI